MPTDAPESSSVCFACGVRGAVLVQDPRISPRQTQAGVDPVHVCVYFCKILEIKSFSADSIVNLRLSSKVGFVTPFLCAFLDAYVLKLAE